MAEKFLTPNIPRFDTVIVPPWNSCGWSLLFLAFSAKAFMSALMSCNPCRKMRPRMFHAKIRYKLWSITVKTAPIKGHTGTKSTRECAPLNGTCCWKGCGFWPRCPESSSSSYIRSSSRKLGCPEQGT